MMFNLRRKQQMSKLKTPYELFGVECGKGWESLYQPILDKVEEINKKDPDNPIEILQIKEKFGQLMIYLSRYTPELTEMCMDASEKSNHICEECGKPAEPRTCDYWIYQLCDECYEKFKVEQLKKLESYESKLKHGEQDFHQETDGC